MALCGALLCPSQEPHGRNAQHGALPPAQPAPLRRGGRGRRVKRLGSTRVAPACGHGLDVRFRAHGERLLLALSHGRSLRLDPRRSGRRDERGGAFSLAALRGRPGLSSSLYRSRGGRVARTLHLLGFHDLQRPGPRPGPEPRRGHRKRLALPQPLGREPLPAFPGPSRRRFFAVSRGLRHRAHGRRSRCLGHGPHDTRLPSGPDEASRGRAKRESRRTLVPLRAHTGLRGMRRGSRGPRTRTPVLLRR